MPALRPSIRPRRTVLTLLCTVLLIPGVLSALRFLPEVDGYTRAADAVILYQDGLAPAWEDWSWGTNLDPANVAPIHQGSASLAVTYTQAWGAVSLRTATPLTASGLSGLEFWAYGGGADTHFSVSVQSTDAGPVLGQLALTAPAGVWTRFTLSMAQLGDPAQIARINWQDALGSAQATFYLDEIRLLAADLKPDPFPDTAPDRALPRQSGPSGVAVAPNGRLYVANWRENRVYSWPNAAAVTQATPPDRLFGGSDTAHDQQTGCQFAPTAGNLCGPESVAVDAAGNLYVADTYFHRVLIYRNPDTDASPTTPDRVLGQGGNFGGQAVSFNQFPDDGIVEGFHFPRGLAVAANGDLWVVDEFNHRVLRFDQPLIGDALPDLVLGQPDLNRVVGQLASGEQALNRMDLPLGVAVDRQGTVYVAEFNNNRILRFDQPAVNGPAGVAMAGFDHAHDLLADGTGALWVAETYAHKVHVLPNPKSDVSPARTYDLQLDYPMGMALDGTGSLYVANCGDYPCQDPNQITVYDRPAQATATHTATATQSPTPASTATPTPTATERADVALTVDVAAQRRPIPPEIYGMNAYQMPGDAVTYLRELGVTVRRWGGNATSRYNWQTDTSNTAMDWYFENYKESNATNLPEDSAANRFVEQNRQAGAASFLTLPMMGYVADGDDSACSFSIAKYGPQQDSDGQWRPDCGNGVLPNGQPVTGNDPGDTSIQAGPQWVADWVAFLGRRYGTAAGDGVRFYNLDNEPDLWFETHRDVAPVGWKYREFLERSTLYGAAVRATDPAARILGPAVNGWTYYWHGAYDGQRRDWETPDDRNANGGTPFVPWYLRQMKAYEEQTGARLLDYLDLHYYPQAPGVSLEPAGEPVTQALRLRSTRSLWDPDYVDESWIAQAGPDGGVVRLIPRMREWIDANYPGTKLAIGEYNWGALDHINGALAQADVLGLFGREGVDLATLWEPPALADPGAFAFRLYRNYDGRGSAFGDMSIHATSSDPGQLAVYGAQRREDGAVTLMMVNKGDESLTVRTVVAGLPAGASLTAQVYRYSSADLTRIREQPEQMLDQGQWTATYPAESITLLVIPWPPLLEHRQFLPAVTR